MLKNKNYQMDFKNYQNFTWNNLFFLLPIQKFWSQTPIQLSFWIAILHNPSQLYDSSSEMLQIVSNVCDKLCETFLIFYHNLHIWYHDILTNLMIFRVSLLFIEFKSNFATRSWSCFVNKMFKISFHFPDNASHWTQ